MMTPQVLIANKYSIGQLLGQGQFGSVYNGIYEKTGDLVAIKLEGRDTGIKLLKQEATILKYLYDQGSRFVPTVYWFGVWSNYTCLVMPLYDCSLHDKVGTLSEVKVDAIMSACISILEDIHSHQVLHCDIKPHHFMIRDRELYLVDFGLATFAVKQKGDELRKRSHLIGSPKYASYFLHNGEHPCYRDDLLSLGYMYYFLLYPNTLVSNILTDDDVEQCKTDLQHPINLMWKQFKLWSSETVDTPSLRTLAIGQKISSYLSYCYHLQMDSTPDYSALKALF